MDVLLTTTQAALMAKLAALDREFDALREQTQHIGWCRKYWWDGEMGSLSIEHWKTCDAWFRSRYLEFPGIGLAMAPCLDMVNHASNENANSYYELDDNGNVMLVLREGKSISIGDEVTMWYV